MVFDFYVQEKEKKLGLRYFIDGKLNNGEYQQMWLMTVTSSWNACTPLTPQRVLNVVPKEIVEDD